METIKLKNNNIKKYVVVHPLLYIWNINVNEIPKYIYDILKIDVEIDIDTKILEWCKLAGSIINGNKFIDFSNNIILSKFNIDKHILYGCWSRECDILKEKKYYNIQNVFNKHIMENKPYTYTQCWMFASIFKCLCELKGIECRIIIGINTKIDINKNFIYDEEDSKWNFHVWNEIKLPNRNKWCAFDCCPSISMNINKSFTMGPIEIDNHKNIDTDDFKYFKHLAEGDDTKIYTYNLVKKDKFKFQRINLLQRYKSII